MGRPKRSDEAGCIYHMLNRANRRDEIFAKQADYEAFEKVLVEAVSRYEIELFSYCLLPNHWHLCVRPRVDGEMSRFAQWLTLTHTQRHNTHYKTVCRYVERNAFAAELCQAPDQWRYGSLYRWKHGTPREKKLLAPWPITRHRNWVGVVTMALSDSELKRLRWSKQRGCPFGEETWVETVARRFDLEMTMRPRGRPRKFPNAGNPS